MGSWLSRRCWSQLGVRFTSDRVYSQLLTLKPRSDPLLALARAGPFPVPTPGVNRKLQPMLPWSADVQKRAAALVRKHTPRSGRFVAVHLNVRASWTMFCKVNASVYNPLFENCAPPGEGIPEDACDPDRATVLTQVAAALQNVGACNVLAITDGSGSDLEHRLDPTDLDVGGCDGGIEMQAVVLPHGLLGQAAAISAAARAHGFIGYCCSRISDLIAREREFTRDLSGKNWLWGISKIPVRKKRVKKRAKIQGKVKNARTEL